MSRSVAHLPPQPATAHRVLDVAERLMQTLGFNGFSYADISAEVGITKATLHHHFATKATLGQALIERYCENFRVALGAIDAGGGGGPRKLERYAHLYREVLSGQRLCLCGMLAAEYRTLPGPMQDGIRQFFDTNESWLAGVIEEGRRARALHVRGSAVEMARMLLGALEGAMLMAWPTNDVERFSSAARATLACLTVTGTRAPPSRTRRPLANVG